MATPPDAAAQFALLLGAIGANRTVNYAYIASCTVLVYDYFLTFQAEVEDMWPARWTIPKILFFVLRYFSFVHLGISSQYHVTTARVGAACNKPFNRLGSVSFIRVYGFSGRKLNLLIFLSVLLAGTGGAQLWFLWKFTTTLVFAELPWRGIGCVPVAGDSLWLSLMFTLGLMNLVIVTGIMMYIAWDGRQLRLKGIGGLVRLFYRDGIFYFVALSTFATANIIFDHTAPPNGTQFTMVQMQVFLNEVFTARMLFHLRAWARRGVVSTNPSPHSGETTTMLGEMEFSNRGESKRSPIPLKIRQQTSTTVVGDGVTTFESQEYKHY